MKTQTKVLEIENNENCLSRNHLNIGNFNASTKDGVEG